MPSSLPRGALRSARKRGEYGNYITWNMLQVLSILYVPESEKNEPWTARRLATEVGTAYQSMLLLLGRCKEKGWVKWGRDRFGRRAWIITEEGMAAAWKEVNRRVSFKLKKEQTIAENLIHIVRRAIHVLHRLKDYGFGDVQARETLIRRDIARIEWAIRTARRRRSRVANMGAYISTLIRDGHQQERRCRTYITAVNYDLDEEVKDLIVAKAMQTVDPFSTVRLAMKGVQKLKDCWEITPIDIGKIFYELSRAGLIKYKPYPSEAA